MGFRNPITTAEDPTARAQAVAAQQAAADAQTTANGAARSAQTANAAAAAAQTAANDASSAAAAASTAAGNAQTAANNITTTQITDGAISTAKIAAGAVTAATIGAGAVTAGKIAAGAVQAGTLAAGAVQAGTVAAGAIDGQTITGATLRTAASGQRVQIDSSNGLIGYNAAGQAVTQVRTSDGALIATGAQITGTLDTRATGTAAGVRIANTASTGAPGGVIGSVQFFDGITGDTPATLTSKPGSSRSDFGGTTELDGGDFTDGSGGRVTLPSLTFDALPGGSAALAGVPLPAAARMGRRVILAGADVVTIPAGTQVQADGVPIVCASKAARDAITWPVGGVCIRSDLGGLPQRWGGDAWRFLTYGTAAGTTDSNGLLSFPHGIPDGQAPVVWVPILTGQSTDPQTLVTKLVSWGQSTTTLTVRVVRSDTGAYFPGNATRLAYVAYF